MKKVDKRQDRLDRMEVRLIALTECAADLDQTQRVLMAAVEELTLQVQFLLRNITDTKEVVGLLDVNPRKVTVRLLDVYRKKKPAVIQELERERQAAEEARTRDNERLRAAIEARGIDPDDRAAVDEYFKQIESGGIPNPLEAEPAERPDETGDHS